MFKISSPNINKNELFFSEKALKFIINVKKKIIGIFIGSCAHGKAKKSPSNLHKKITGIKTQCVNYESCAETIADINISKNDNL